MPTHQPITIIPCCRPRFLASSFSKSSSILHSILIIHSPRPISKYSTYLTMSPSITNTMRRFSRGSGNRNSANSNTGAQQSNTTGTGAYTPPLDGHPQSQGISRTSTSNNPLAQHSHTHNSRPVSSDSSHSFEHMNRPVSQQYNQGGSSHMPGTTNTTSTGGAMNALPGGHQSLPHSAIGGLSRTDQVVLRYFWEEKYLDNAKRDLHFVSFCHLTPLIT